ncbi:MAG: HNH endonuclease, partial [Anaerolineales bacterium]|nr:HNH endonuclease [Anaerolineales bacterium]
AIRTLHQRGILIKVRKGVYRYDPSAAQMRDLEIFTSEQKEAIFRRDNYRCVICGRGREDGYEIHADHIIPKDFGGKAVIENGQTLCSIHNFRKKNYKQTETGKRLFIHLYELARSIGDLEMMDFCEDVLSVYEKHRINDHIAWKSISGKQQEEAP